MLNNLAIMYVEDDKTTQEYLKMILQDRCKELFLASDGVEGLNIYKSKNPDIVISDIKLPNIDGLTMIEAIKSINKYQPVIIISAYDNRENLLKAINIGCSAFIKKPIDVEFLFDKLNIIAKKIEEERIKMNNTNKEIESLYALAHYDFLTNIPNRFLFEIELKRAISMVKRKNDKLTLFFIDLDNFKEINDSFGHEIGDFVLKSIVNNLSKIIRKEDILARRSGDEFLLMTIGSQNKERLSKIANKIIKACSKPLNFHRKSISITCSIGISIYPDDADNFKDLIRCADRAMYKAKKTGKSRYAFYKD